MPTPCSPSPDPVRTLLNKAGMICRQLSLAYSEGGPTYAALQQAAREIEALPLPAGPEGVTISRTIAEHLFGASLEIGGKCHICAAFRALVDERWPPKREPILPTPDATASTGK